MKPDKPGEHAPSSAEAASTGTPSPSALAGGECPARKVLERLLPYITRVNHIHLREEPKEILYASAVYDALAIPCPCESLRAENERLKANPHMVHGSLDGVPIDWPCESLLKSAGEQIAKLKTDLAEALEALEPFWRTIRLAQTGGSEASSTSTAPDPGEQAGTSSQEKEGSNAKE